MLNTFFTFPFDHPKSMRRERPRGWGFFSRNDHQAKTTLSLPISLSFFQLQYKTSTTRILVLFRTISCCSQIIDIVKIFPDQFFQISMLTTRRFQKAFFPFFSQNISDDDTIIKWKGQYSNVWEGAVVVVQSVTITANVVSSNPAHGEVYSIQHYVTKFIRDLLQVGGFIRVLRFPPPKN